MENCELCASAGGRILLETAQYRVVRIAEDDYPGFCRVIWRAHVREMTDLPPADRLTVMSAVLAVETAVRQLFSPDKINLASLGNMTPHLHWHIIPRWQDDRHFPNPIWGTAQHARHISRPAVSDQALSAEISRLLSENGALVE